MTEETESEMSAWEPAAPEKNIARLSRDEVLELASDLIEYLHDRSCGPRFRPYETDSVRLQYQRVLVAAFSAYGSLLRDQELDTLKRRVEQLELIKKGD